MVCVPQFEKRSTGCQIILAQGLDIDLFQLKGELELLYLKISALITVLNELKSYFLWQTHNQSFATEYYHNLMMKPIFMKHSDAKIESHVHNVSQEAVFILHVFTKSLWQSGFEDHCHGTETAIFDHWYVSSGTSVVLCPRLLNAFNKNLHFLTGRLWSTPILSTKVLIKAINSRCNYIQDFY